MNNSFWQEIYQIFGWHKFHLKELLLKTKFRYRCQEKPGRDFFYFDSFTFSISICHTWMLFPVELQDSDWGLYTNVVYRHLIGGRGVKDFVRFFKENFSISLESKSNLKLLKKNERFLYRTADVPLISSIFLVQKNFPAIITLKRFSENIWTFPDA